MRTDRGRSSAKEGLSSLGKRELDLVVVLERAGELVGGHGVVREVLAPHVLGLLALLVLGAELALLAGALLVGEDEGGVVVERRAAEGRGEDADRRQDEAGPDLDEGRRVAFLRWEGGRWVRAVAAGWGLSRRAVLRSGGSRARAEPSDSGACLLSLTKRLRVALERRLSAPPVERSARDSVRTGL